MNTEIPRSPALLRIAVQVSLGMTRQGRHSKSETSNVFAIKRGDEPCARPFSFTHGAGTRPAPYANVFLLNRSRSGKIAQQQPAAEDDQRDRPDILRDRCVAQQ